MSYRAAARTAHITSWALAAAVATFVGASCSNSSSLAGLPGSCSINSDCSGSDICAFGRCHQQCTSSKDCQGATCLAPQGVCELAQEATCSSTLPCVTGLTCADSVCRAPCTPGVAAGTTGGCLASQSCVTVAGSTQTVCIDAAGDAGATKDTGTKDAGTKDTGTKDAGTRDSGHDSSSPRDVGTDLGVVTLRDAGGGFSFTPSNFTLATVDAGSLAGDGGPWAMAPDANITGDSDCYFGSPCGSPFTVTQSDGTQATLYILHSLTVIETAQLTLSGPNPVILAVLTTVSIQGAVYLGDGKAGGFGGSVPGPGVGQGDALGFADSSGAGGGSFCGVGGTGGYTTGAAPVGGTTYGMASLVPLVGGSAGAGSAVAPGGGALQIVAGQSITIGPNAHVNACGQGAQNNQGGGSGGAILLEAPTVVVEGTIAANGGGGGGTAFGGDNGADGNASATPALGGLDTYVDGGTAAGGVGSAGTTTAGGNGGAPDPRGMSGGGGGGGAGRIRINTASGSAMLSGVLSPGASTSCMTQGKLGQ
jgi:hypothetical protein